FFALREAFDDARLLPLERLAFKYLWNAPAQKINARFHFFSECVGLAARQGQQARAVNVLEIVDVAAIRRGLSLEAHFLNHADDHPAATGAGKTADEQVVSRGVQLNAHAQGAQRAILSQV